MYKHFPLLKPFNEYTRNNKDQTIKNELDILERLSKFMRILRDVYSHYRCVPYSNQLAEYEEIEPFVRGGIKVCYTGSKREVKSRFAYSVADMLCAEEHSGKGKDGKLIKRQGFNYNLFKKDETGHYHLSVFGLVFLTSLFLEKKYSKIFCDKTNCVNFADEKVICEMLAIYNIRLHIQKLTVTKDVDALALDIINELQRCPKQLYEMLPPSEQEKFRIKPQRGEGNSDVLMIRHTDRFAPMVMKYIDDAKLFQDIRFQVSMGKYFFKFYNKKCIDSSEPDRVRALCKDIHGFGRLSDIEEARNNVWAELIREYEDVHRNTADEKPYVTDHHAQYLVSGNRIGLHFCDDGNHIRMPELTEDGTQNESPDCFLSCYELPAMAFLIHLKGGGERVEEIIKSTAAQYRKLFADIRDGKLQPVSDEDSLRQLLANQYGGIRVECLPTNVRQYLLMQQTDVKKAFQTWAEEYISQQIEYTKRKQKKFRDDRMKESDPKQNKFGKKSYVSIKPGRLAAYMAKDMMMFQPNDEDNKGKLTGLNFRVLQAVLATYDGDMDSLLRVLHNAKILGIGCNPVVNRVFSTGENFGSTASIYNEYLTCRIGFLQKCLQTRNFEELGFLYPNRTCWQERDTQFYQQLAGRYLCDSQDDKQYAKAIELPRGLFEYEIRKELAGIEATSKVAEDKTKNVAYLIYAYFKNVIMDDCQPFYESKRCYALFNRLYKQNPQASSFYFSAAEIRTMLIRKNEKSIRKDIESYVNRQRKYEQLQIRKALSGMLTSLKNVETDLKRQKTEDMLLFLIAQRILIASNERGNDVVRFDAFSSMKLRDLLSDNVLSHPIRLSIKVKSHRGINKIIYQDDIKLKNYSQFYRFLSDRRLPTLLDLTYEKNISRKTIEEEFSNYDKVHPYVLQEVFNYESEYLKTLPEEEHIDRLKFSDIINNDDLLKSHSDLLVEIRNSFAHGHYPNKEKVQIALTSVMPEKAKKVSETFSQEIKK